MILIFFVEIIDFLNRGLAASYPTLLNLNIFLLFCHGHRGWKALASLIDCSIANNDLFKVVKVILHAICVRVAASFRIIFVNSAKHRDLIIIIPCRDHWLGLASRYWIVIFVVFEWQTIYFDLQAGRPLWMHDRCIRLRIIVVHTVWAAKSLHGPLRLQDRRCPAFFIKAAHAALELRPWLHRTSTRKLPDGALEFSLWSKWAAALELAHTALKLCTATTCIATAVEATHIWALELLSLGRHDGATGTIAIEAAYVDGSNWLSGGRSFNADYCQRFILFLKLGDLCGELFICLLYFFKGLSMAFLWLF